MLPRSCCLLFFFGFNLPLLSNLGVNNTVAHAQSDGAYWDNYVQKRVPKRLWNKYQGAKKKQGVCVAKGIWSAVAYHKLSWDAAIQAAYNASSCHDLLSRYP